MRLIDADEFKRRLIREINVSGKYTPYECGIDDAICWLNDAPTIEVQPVVHGEWILDEYGNPHCSVCEHVQDAQTSYCSECGTKMDGGDQNEQPAHPGGHKRNTTAP